MARSAAPTWNDLPARFTKPGRVAVLGIVLHDTAGNGTHRDTLYLVDPSDGRQVSADFTVERDGSIWKLNPDLASRYCNHAGRATSWRGHTNAQVNRVTFGIEIVQHRALSLRPLYPEVQVASTACLCAWIVSTFGLSPADIVTHRQIVTDGSRIDPREFPFDGNLGFWARFWQSLKGRPRTTRQRWR